MIEANGHKWLEGSFYDRCMRCQMKYKHYFQIKQASEDQPDRQDIKDCMTCKK